MLLCRFANIKINQCLLQIEFNYDESIIHQRLLINFDTFKEIAIRNQKCWICHLNFERNKVIQNRLKWLNKLVNLKQSATKRDQFLFPIKALALLEISTKKSLRDKRTAHWFWIQEIWNDCVSGKVFMSTPKWIISYTCTSKLLRKFRIWTSTSISKPFTCKTMWSQRLKTWIASLS